MCVTCIRQMAEAIEKESAAAGYQVLPPSAMDVIEILKQSDGNYDYVIRMLAVYFAMYPTAFVQLVAAVQRALEDRGEIMGDEFSTLDEKRPN